MTLINPPSRQGVQCALEKKHMVSASWGGMHLIDSTASIVSGANIASAALATSLCALVAFCVGNF